MNRRIEVLEQMARKTCREEIISNMRVNSLFGAMCTGLFHGMCGFDPRRPETITPANVDAYEVGYLVGLERKS